MSPARAVAVSLLVLSAHAAVARAQMPGMPGNTRPINLVISGGMTVPAADLADLHDAGLHFDASLLLNIPGFPVALRPEFSLTRFKLKEPVLTGANTDDVTQMIAAMGNLELPLAGGLYVLAGGGILSLSLPGAASTGGTDESASKFTFDAGAGFRFALGGARGFVEARIGAASYDQGKFGFSKAQFIPVTFGLVF
ncbi:MAG TPA: hypothetical protein VIK50_05040 [Gemmatimonadaceae bacterium]